MHSLSESPGKSARYSGKTHGLNKPVTGSTTNKVRVAIKIRVVLVWGSQTSQPDSRGSVVCLIREEFLMAPDSDPLSTEKK